MGWCSKSLLPAQFVYINRSGLTQFRLRFSKEDDNNAIADLLMSYSVNTAYRPVLVVHLYEP